MDGTLQKSFERLEKTAGELFERLRGLTPEQLAFRPGPEQWNCLQVLQHLQLVEHFTCASIEKGMKENGSGQKITLRATLIFALLRTLLRLPLKFKIPTPRVAPNEGLTFNEIAALWRENRLKLKEYLQEIPDGAEKESFYRHPMIGYLNARQTLKFLQSHFDHHLVQIRRIEKAADFPR